MFPYLRSPVLISALIIHFSKTIMSRVMYDGMTQTVNGKIISIGYLRNAYLQYDNGKLTLRGGLIGVEQISMAEKFWNYRYITKTTNGLLRQ